MNFTTLWWEGTPLGSGTVATLLARITIVLACAWLCDLGLRTLNPRWRILTCRAAAIGIVLMVAMSTANPIFRLPVLSGSSAAKLTNDVRVTAPVFGEKAPSIDLTAAVSGNPVTTPTNPVSFERNWLSSNWLAIGWIAGVMIGWVRIAVGMATLLRIRRESPLADSQLSAEATVIANRLGVKKTFEVRLSDLAIAPCGFGLWRKTLLLPSSVAQATDRQAKSDRRSMLAHELAHVAGADLARNAALQFLGTLLWFHPLTWRMGIAHIDACDERCDAVATELSADRESYSRLLARVALAATCRAPIGALPMARTPQIVRRLRLLSAPLQSAKLVPSRTVLALGAACALVLFVGGTTLERAIATESYSSASTAANPTSEQRAVANQGIKRKLELEKELATDPVTVLEPNETLRYLPPGTNSKSLQELKTLLGSDGEQSSLRIRAVDGVVEIHSWSADGLNPLYTVLENVLGVGIHEIVLKGWADFAQMNEFLATPFPGDWVASHQFDKDRPRDQQELTVMAHAISSQLGGKYRMVIEKHTTPVFVATGEYVFKFSSADDNERTEVTGKVAEIGDGEFWIPIRRMRTTGQVCRSFNEFLNCWAGSFMIPIVNEVQKLPLKSDFFVFWSDHQKTSEMFQALKPDEEQKMIRSFEQQTGLKLTKTQRSIPVVEIERLAE